MPSSIALLVTGVSTGLLAGGASCAVVQGGLLAGAVTRRDSGPAAAAAESASVASPRPPSGATAAREESRHLAPVGAFLTGKLVSHTALGALLGVFGAALQPTPRTQALLMLGAAALMVLFALDLFGVKAVGRLVPRPPAAFGRLARRSGRSASASAPMVAPAVVGLVTVLVPCGVTLSVELIAMTTGSPVAGAAVMAGFVLGTAPLFAVLGYLFRRSSRALSGRLGIATGVVVLAIAVWTVRSGLQAGGWATFSDPGTPVAAAPPRPAGPVSPMGTEPPESTPTPEESEPDPATAAVHIDATGRQILTLTVTDGYHPRAFLATAGMPTTLLHGDDSGGCARAFTIPSRGIQEIVKRNGDTPVDLGTPKPGTLKFSCSMGMATGQITFKEGTAP
ncbi:sulfite exporter TauE/SafE family protein [Yinghuangia seranimata]|uniref:urease accessory protein UreH domain-containing protein n=1 Tax=Yinghuangia seranimata TaxID=408067 RepID=UPI00248B6C8A|nr:sulfite exporter TauE/SafE family protein [Yinghuangia seranimata]MDI2130156.1 sulfite exporter TauE/SafE family protein [Yinghuangia seranimata]